ncbi:MAG TPA: hypothetical protein VFU38_06335 [Candidatus Krumholzibacteria bacterium]|nr:hypothetical protein [Candidatus Krumholzibacteria bacterium]
MAVARTKPGAVKPDRAARRVGPGRAILIPLILLLAVAAIGTPYYFAPHAERLRHALHPWFRPSGYVGQTAGIVTFAGFLFMWLFPLRKRLRKHAWLGPVPRWLDVHIGVGLMLPLVGAIHAGFRFGGVIGIGYIAMLIVCLSGFIGRYLYVRIPRSRSGVEMSLSELSAQQRVLLAEIADATRLSVIDVQDILKVESGPVRAGVVAAFAQMVRDDLARGRALRVLRRRLVGTQSADKQRLRSAMALARREMSLSQQARLLDATHSIFRHWHAAHRPVAITAFIAVTIHVVVVVVVGATWF